MSLAEIVGKGRTRAADLATRRAGREYVHVDVGTGEGRMPYAIAQEHPEWFVIGIDALAEPMEEMAQKAFRKPAKGGVENLMFVRASIEQLPRELHGVANAVSVVLPWGHLLEGIVLGQDDVIAGIAALCTSGASVRVTLNGEMWASTPARFTHLPLPTPGHVADVVAPAFARAGIDLMPAYWMSLVERRSFSSAWARKLAYQKPPAEFVHFNGICR